MLGVEEANAGKLAAEIQRVVAGAKIDDNIVVGAEQAVGDRQDVIRARAVDRVHTEYVVQLIGAGRQIQGVEALLQIDGDAADIVAERQRIVRSGSGKIGRIDILDIGYAQRV